MKRVHCLGLVAVEAVSRAMAGNHAGLPRSPVLTDSLRFTPGGGAGTTAAALAQLGVPVGLFARVGADGHGSYVTTALRKLGVEVSQVREVPGADTPLSYVTLRTDGRRSAIYTPGANQGFTPKDVDRGQVLQAGVLVYSDCGALPGWDGAPLLALLKDARRLGLLTVLDVQAETLPPLRVFEKAVALADWVLPSTEDLAALYPGRSAEAALARLRQLGAAQVLLTCGAAGAVLQCGGTCTALPSVATKVVDVSGAGAACVAGLAAGLAQGLDALAAAQLSQRVAAIGVEQPVSTRRWTRLPG